MRLLHIAPEPPSCMSGGGIGIRQTLLSLKMNHYTVDYVGPEIPNRELSLLYDKTYILKPSHNLFLRIFDTFFMNTNQRYRSWLKLDINFSSYDMIIMDFTKLHYVLKRIGTVPLVVRVHNVEHDYSCNSFSHHRSLLNFIDKCFAGHRERIIVQRSKCLIAITDKDKRRLCQLYDIPVQKISVIPVCIQKRMDRYSRHKLNSRTQCLHMLITGSLWYGSNYEGILWFIKNVYYKLSIPKELCIAGAHPNSELLAIIEDNPTIILADTPPDIAPYFLNAELFIAPIFDGAGMKVKVAEALSYAIPVVGTHHAFEGYEISHGKNSYIADTAGAFQKSILDFYNMNEEERCCMHASSLQLFQSFYSLEKSADAFRRLFVSVSS